MVQPLWSTPRWSKKGFDNDIGQPMGYWRAGKLSSLMAVRGKGNQKVVKPHGQVLAVVTVLTLLLLSLGVQGTDHRQPGTTSAVTVELSEGSSRQDAYTGVDLSEDGRFIVFASLVEDLVEGDTNGQGEESRDGTDIFLYDRIKDSISRVSLSSAGEEADGPSYAPSISNGGRYVAFESGAENLASSDGNDELDVFVRDRNQGETRLVSIAENGTQGNGPSGSPFISADGRFIAFRSHATNLVPGDTNGEPDIFLWERESGSITRVNVATDGSQAKGGLSFVEGIAADGSSVLFRSQAWNLAPNDTNNEFDVFYRAVEAEETSRVSLTPSGDQYDSVSLGALSGDGKTVAVVVLGRSEMLIHDAVTSSSRILETKSHHEYLDKDVRNGFALSEDGTFGAYCSDRAYAYNFSSEITKMVSLNPDGDPANAEVKSCAISADGGTVGFITPADNLVPGDTEKLDDVFVRDINRSRFVPDEPDKDETDDISGGDGIGSEEDDPDSSGAPPLGDDETKEEPTTPGFEAWAIIALAGVVAVLRKRWS